MSILDYIEKIKQENEGPRITAQEPRTMVADASTEMEQSPDSFLRPKRYDILTGLDVPAETLEDWDTSFRNPNAQGGRIGFYEGKQVTMKGHPRQGEWVVPTAEWNPVNKKSKTVQNYFPDEDSMKEWIKSREAERTKRLVKHTPEQYSQLYDEYVELVNKGFREENLVDVPRWEKFLIDKTGKPSGIWQHPAKKTNKPMSTATAFRAKKRLELAEKLIAAENLKLDGIFWRAKGGKAEGKGNVASLFEGKVIPKTKEGVRDIMNSYPDLMKLVKNKLHKRENKVRGAFNFIMNNPDYQLKTNSIKTEIRHLMKEPSDFFNPKSKTGMANVWNELSKPYEYTDLKTGKVENKLEKIMLKLKHMPPDSDKSIGYLLEMAENHRLGRTGFSDWEKLAGRKPEQWAMQEVNRAWAKKDPNIKFYDMNGKPITWEAGKKLKSSEILFSYANKDFPGFNNKLYSFYKPGKEALKKINELNPDKKVFALDGNIRNLDEFKEVVKVVEGRNNLNNTKMFNPFRNKETTYKTYFEDIYKQVGVAGRKGDYTRAKAMSAHIDHEFGRGKNLFNNLRLATGQQNQMFKTLEDAALKNPELRPYVKRLEAEIYGGGSIDNQIKSIVKQTDDIGKIVASSPGKVILPTAMDTAAYKFLKNEIPGMPESVIRYLTPYAEKAKESLKGQPELEKTLLDNFWCRSPKASGGRIGFASGSGCPDSVKRKNFIAFNNDVRAGKITGEAAKDIAKNTAKVVAKAGSKSALASLLGPAGIGIDVIYEVASVGTDIYGGKPWKEAVQDNWIAGAFMPGTSLEEFHKRLYEEYPVGYEGDKVKKYPEAKPYGQGLLLEEAYFKTKKEIDRLKAETTARGRAEAEKRLPELERDLRGIVASYNALGNAMVPGSPEYENYMAAKTEYLDARKAKAPSTKARLKMELDRPTSDRAVSYQKGEPVKMDFSLPGNYTTFRPDLPPQLGGTLPTKREIDELYTKEGYDLSPQDIDYVQKLEKWNQLFYNPENKGMGIRGTQDWRGAGGGRAGYMGGGIAGIRKPHAIPPERQGLRSIMINGKKS